jgi:hypothetical protein
MKEHIALFLKAIAIRLFCGKNIVERKFVLIKRF